MPPLAPLTATTRPLNRLSESTTAQAAHLRPTHGTSYAADKENKVYSSRRGAKEDASRFPSSGLGNEKLRSTASQPLSGLPHNQLQASRLKHKADIVGKEVDNSALPIDVMNTNFEEWMKMATDNRINANNSWNFALIDYFHDMSLLREGDGINFTKASCTLDGCVKIYSSRVDSIAAETGKLLSGLTEDSHSDRNVSEDANGDVGQLEDDKRAKRRPARQESTLAANFSALSIKKFELDFAVDPLFQKTSADFDEGGARGLLLNHLCVDSAGRVVFDSTDAGLDDDENGSRDKIANPEQFGLSSEDLGTLRDCLIPNLSSLNEYHICPSLSNFTLSDHLDASTSEDIAILHDQLQTKVHEEVENSTFPSASIDAESQPQEDFFADVDFDNSYGDAFSEDGDLEADASRTELQPQTDLHSKHFSGPPNASDLVLAMSSLDLNDNNAMFSYFDNAFTKRWSGAEHWKMRRAPVMGSKAKIGSLGADKIAPKKSRIARADFLDFHSIPDEQTLFRKPKNAATLQQSSSSFKTGKGPKTKAEKANLLADQAQFNSSQLLRLFTKPRCQIQFAKSFRQHRVESRPDDEIDTAFWARATHPQAAAPQEAKDSSDACIDQYAQYEDQFFDDNGGDDADHTQTHELDTTPRNEEIEGSSGDYQGSIPHSSEVSRKVKPEYVPYTKVVKKVDVKRLKDDIWRQLEVTARASFTGNERDPGSVSMKDSPQIFSTVISGLKDSYTANTLKDISTSYCFICLLHLANEKGLSIRGDDNLQELEIFRECS